MYGRRETYELFKEPAADLPSADDGPGCCCCCCCDVCGADEEDVAGVRGLEDVDDEAPDTDEEAVEVEEGSRGGIWTVPLVSSGRRWFVWDMGSG